MQGFQGFPDGIKTYTSIPGLFFSDLLPIIDHLIELKVTLYALWAWSQQKTHHRYIRLSEVYADQHFMKGIHNHTEYPREAVQDGFERAVARGTLLQAQAHSPQGPPELLFFLNSEGGRETLHALSQGDWQPRLGANRDLKVTVERPNVFVLYEQNIGALTPIIVEQLRDLQKDYGDAWVEDAIRISSQNNVNSLRYITKILARWQREGRDGENGALTNREAQEAQAKLEAEEFERKFRHMF